MPTNPEPITAPEREPAAKRTKPAVTGERSAMAQFSVYLGLLVPMIALIVAVPFAWGWGLSWIGVGLFLVFYVISGLGITIDFHRRFSRDLSNVDRFAPDLVADPLISRINRLFLLWTLLSLTAPALIGGLITWSLWGAVTAFFWAGLVRVCVLHHVTWPLAIFSFGESWHNLHHADPTCARHGVRRGQIDISARTIWLFEKLGWAYDVRRPTPQRLNRLAQRTTIGGES